ncbi:MAG: beta-propeller domain-containing protein [Microlunatus sp.]
MTEFDDRARAAADAVRRRMAELPIDHEAGLRRVRRSPARVALPALVAAAVLITAVAVGLPRIIAGFPSGAGGATSGEAGAAAALTGGLTPFDSCDTALRYFKDQAPAYLIEQAGGRAYATSEDTQVQGAPVPSQGPDASGSAESAGGGTQHSDTNVQEAGIDEPDIVKTDGRRIVAVAESRVHLISTSKGKLTLRKTLPGATARNVFLSGNRLLVFGDQEPRLTEPRSAWAGTRAVVTMYDIADLSNPKLIATLTIDGQVLDARLAGTQVRMVTVASPDVDIPSPTYTRDGQIDKKSMDRLRAAVARSTIDDWIPSYVLTDGRGAQVDKGRLVQCPDLARPEKFSGIDTVAVASFDINSALQSRRTVGVIAGGEQIYASSTGTYVSTTEWRRDGSPVTTSVHKFVTAPSGATSYTGSGEVRGALLNQYAMSEYEGVLRVASTISERRGWVGSREVTEGIVTTLKEHDGVLRQLGQVDGLGRQDNESIRAVRFIADRGYVVTFRQTDPLYVLDLRDPAAPKVLGELKIPGYSGYLHPVGKNLLLGVGQSGAGDRLDDQAGVQFSLFDVSNAAAPRRIDVRTLGAGSAGAEFDPKAFLYWQPRKLVIAPTYLYGDDQGRGTFSGVVMLRLTMKGLTELGKVSVAEKDGMTNRSLVIGDAVYLLSDQAIQTADLDTLRGIDTLKF